MQVSYSVNLVIFSLFFDPQVEFDIQNIHNCFSGSYLYRGSLTFKRGLYTVKITRNGFCSIYLRRNFSSVLANIEDLALEVYMFLKDFTLQKIDIVKITPKNIQITFHITFQVIPDFKFFCRKLVESYENLYEFEVKESNSYDSVWLPYVNTNLYFSGIRIKIRGSSKCVFTLLYSYKGSCLTDNVLDFCRVCDNIRECYLNNEGICRGI